MTWDFCTLLPVWQPISLSGNERAKEAAILAADQLISRFQEKGEFIQAWGELGAEDNYRLIIRLSAQSAFIVLGF